jgi:sialic acid synthase SpsE
MAKCEIIADLGSNIFAGADSKQRAIELIQLAKESNCTAVKLQLLRGDKLYRDPAKQKQLRPYELPIEWLPELKQVAGDIDIELLVTPFYLEAVDALERLGVERYKIASSDILYHDLHRLIAQTGKPVILSTGAAEFSEIETAIETLRPGNETPDDLVLLHCNVSYPCPIPDMQLRKILDLASEFYPLRVGYSSHTVSPYLVASSVLYNAEVIEIHFDAEDRKGVETAHSYTPSQVRQLVQMVDEFEKARDCGCAMTLSDAIGRSSYFRDPSDGLRPLLSDAQ